MLSKGSNFIPVLCFRVSTVSDIIMICFSHSGHLFMSTTTFDGKKSNFLISLLNFHGILMLYSLISGTMDTQKNSFVVQQLLYMRAFCP